MAERFCMSADLLEDGRMVVLRRKLGAQAVVGLIKLYSWAARFKPEGVLDGMGPEDIEQIAGHTDNMTGKALPGNVPGAFVEVLLDVGFLVEYDTGAFALVDFGDTVVVDKRS